MLEEEVPTSSASWPWYLVLCWLTWVARSTALLLGLPQSSRPLHPVFWFACSGVKFKTGISRKSWEFALVLSWKKRYQRAPPCDLGTLCCVSYFGLWRVPRPTPTTLSSAVPWTTSNVSRVSLTLDANYSNLENYAFDAKYSDFEYFDRGLLEVWLNHVSAYVKDIIQILNNTPQLFWSKYSDLEYFDSWTPN